MKKFLSKNIAFLTVLTMTAGLFSGATVKAATKISVPKKVVISYDAKNKSTNGYFSNVIWLNGTSSVNMAYKVNDGTYGYYSTNKKVCNNFYTVFDGSHAGQYAGVGMQIKKTGTTKVSFKVRCGKKIYNCKTTVKVVKYANPFKKILLDNTDITKYYNHKFSSQESSLGKTISLKPNKNWKIKSCYLYKNGKKLKKLKGSSYRLPEDTSMTLTMTNKKTKVVETLKFDYADFGDYDLDIY